MATVATSKANAVMRVLVMMLGAAVFLNYVDRGAIAIAAPLMKTELGLDAKHFGIAVSAFFWIYAPVQLVIGWLCDRFSVYLLIALGVILWAVSTLMMGFVGGFVSLAALRIMLGVGESIIFPASSKIICCHVPPQHRGVANAWCAAGIAFGPAAGTLAGGLILANLGWRAIFIAFGILTLVWLLPWRQVVAALPAAERQETGVKVPIGQLVDKWALWSMGIGHATSNFGFYFLLAFTPLYLVQHRGLSIEQMTLLATLGYAVQGAAAFALGFWSDFMVRTGWSEDHVRRGLLSVGQFIAGASILGIVLTNSVPMIGLLLCTAGIGTACLSTNLYAVAQMFSGPRAAGTWIGFQNGLGNVSGIIGPVIAGVLIDKSGYDSAFYLAAAVSTFGGIWWLAGVPKIQPIRLD